MPEANSLPPQINRNDCVSDSISCSKWLANSKLVSTAAAKVAERLVKDTESAADDAFIRTAFTTLLATAPTAAEQQLCAESLAQFLAAAKSGKSAQPEAKARAALVHALLNHNDFITIR